MMINQCWLWLFGGLLVASCVGSFLGVVLYRLPLGLSAVNGRSHCEACLVPLRVTDLIPVVSFFVLRGRCRSCGMALRGGLLAIELVTMALSGIVILVSPSLTVMAFGLVLAWGLLVLSWFDVVHFYLPDIIVLPLLLLGLVETWLADPASLTSHALATAMGYGSLTGINAAYRAWRHHDGLGQGDAKLLALGGAWLGWAALPGVVAIAAMIGLLLALSWRLTQQRQLTSTLRLPFGACLAPTILAACLAQTVGLLQR